MQLIACTCVTTPHCDESRQDQALDAAVAPSPIRLTAAVPHLPITCQHDCPNVYGRLEGRKADLPLSCRSFASADEAFACHRVQVHRRGRESCGGGCRCFLLGRKTVPVSSEGAANAAPSILMRDRPVAAGTAVTAANGSIGSGKWLRRSNAVLLPTVTATESEEEDRSQFLKALSA